MTASRRQCAAYGCQNYANKCPAQTRFPANRERCEDWARRIFRSDLLGKKNEARWKNAVVCSHHFPDSMYVCPDQRHEPGVRLMPTNCRCDLTSASVEGKTFIHLKSYEEASLVVPSDAVVAAVAEMEASFQEAPSDKFHEP
uniref:THAP-type domain-containing protein n=1 Tax=Macrostomum lignano TaxID=282301 RepID=A0A1I8FZS8_9PLAT